MTIDKDSNGHALGHLDPGHQQPSTGLTNSVYVNSTTGGDSMWGTPS